MLFRVHGRNAVVGGHMFSYACLLRYRVLDEVDRMMAMGFIEDVEIILKAEEEHQVGCLGRADHLHHCLPWLTPKANLSPLLLPLPLVSPFSPPLGEDPDIFIQCYNAKMDQGLVQPFLKEGSQDGGPYW